MIDGELTGHDCRAAAVAIVDDFEHVAALLRGQGCEPPVIVSGYDDARTVGGEQRHMGNCRRRAG
jgi:hypothetical protein